MAWQLLAAAYAADTAFNILGQREADKAQARAERANARYYAEQAKYFKEAGERELQVFKRQADRMYDAQVSAYAKSAFGLSGSARNVLAQSQFVISQEAHAIEAESNFRVRLALMRARSSHITAGDIEGTRDKRSFGLLLGGAVRGSEAYYRYNYNRAPDDGPTNNTGTSRTSGGTMTSGF